MLRKFKEEKYPGAGEVVEKAIISGFLNTRNNSLLSLNEVTVKDEPTKVLGGNPFISVSYYDNDEKKYVNTIFNIVAWRGVAERFAKAAKVGAYTIVTGTIKERPYKVNGTDEERIALDLIVESFDVEYSYTKDMVKKNSSSTTNNTSTSTTEESTSKQEDLNEKQTQTVPPTGGAADDDLPF